VGEANIVTKHASGEAPSETEDEIARFRTHHAALHEAARAVLHASDGRIRRLV
jgi:hypothetical protein